MKIVNKIIPSILGLTMSCVNVLPAISCSTQNLSLSDFTLYTNNDSLKPGESTQITTITHPILLSPSHFTWEITKESFPGVTISNKGKIYVPLSITVDCARETIVQATYKKNPLMVAFISIFVVPPESEEFCGFENDTLEYLDRYDQVVSTKIIKSGESSYTISKPIDVWELKDPPKPSGWTSLINFKPIFRSQQTIRWMKFNIRQLGPVSRATIMWNGDYSDGAWNLEIPSFIGYDPSYIMSTIDVHFACDPDVCLSIPVHVWQEIDQQTDGVIAYIPSSAEDPHSIQIEGMGIYSSTLMCPAKRRTGTYTNSMPCILCHRQKYEFLEYEFECRNQETEDPDIRKSLHFETPQHPEYHIRSYDQFPYYIYWIEYTFDLSTMPPFTPQNEPLFQLRVTDPAIGKQVMACYCNFSIQWIDE